MLSSVSLRSLLLISTLLRVLLIAYGEWQDRHFAVQFTDIDYHVFSDAALHITQGDSPYSRPTYRYTPLLALILTPNHYLFFSFGKFVFVTFDLLTGWLIYKVLSLRHISETLKLLSCACWLLNPLTATVSSRGNAESLLSFLVLSCLYLLICRRTIAAAVLFGLAVHMKIFPIMYSLPMFLFIDEHYTGGVGGVTGRKRAWLVGLLTRERLKFTIVSAATFALTTLFCFVWCGMDFIHEGYLYHVTRRDTRHNFSVWFYMLYLIQDSWLSLPVGLLAFLPQALLLIASALWLYRDLPFCCFVQTFVFVTFNKVCTSQYFLWYLCLLPLIVPSSRLKPCSVVTMTSLWFLGQVLWLVPAYYLEFQGYNTFTLIWTAGIALFVINVFIIVRIIQHHSFCPTLKNGHVTELHLKNS